MAAGYCTACSEQISEQSAVCPYCGGKLTKGPPGLMRVLAWCTIVFITFAWYPVTDQSDLWLWVQWAGGITIFWFLRRKFLRGRNWARLTFGVLSVPVGFYFLLFPRTGSSTTLIFHKG